MRNRKRSIAILMLIILGVISLKVLLPNIGIYVDCNEFAHIHFHAFQKNELDKSNLQTNSAPTESDDGCHEGKSVLSYSLFPAAVFNLELPNHDIIFNLVFILDSHFKSPHLEPHRKPPKVS